MPRRVRFDVSEGGVTYRVLGLATHDVPDREMAPVTRDFAATATSPTRARYVRVTVERYGRLPDWHPGKGEESWFFADEIVVERSPAAQHPSALEKAVLDEINWARTHPGQAADYLDNTIAPLFLLENKEAFKDEPTTRAPLPEEHGLYRTTQEGLGLVRETAAWLRAQRPRPAVAWNDTLGRMAVAMVTLQGPSGEMGHDRHGGDWMSLASRQDPRLVCCGETNSYGSEDPRTIVIDLIVDDGVPSRGHRATVFDVRKGYDVVGIAVGPHTTHRFMCVIDWGVLRPARSEH
jgi:uncharacterized protein YkwD